MRIVCPACGVAYQVPDERLSPGRLVRCARCEADWAPLALEAPAEVVPAADAAASPVPEAAIAPPPAPETFAAALPVAPAIGVEGRPVPRAASANWALRIAWALSVLLVGGAGAAAFVARDDVMRLWPASVRGYAALGLPPRH